MELTGNKNHMAKIRQDLAIKGGKMYGKYTHYQQGQPTNRSRLSFAMPQTDG